MENIKNLRFSNPEKLLETLGITGIPDVVQLASKFDLLILKLQFNRNFANIRGMLDVQGESRRIIINSNMVDDTKRFICAYLFSDYQLNCCPNSDYANILYDESIYDKSVYSYALRLLMPKYLFDEDLPYIEDYEDIQKLAEKYQVSEYLIRERGKIDMKQKDLKEKSKGFRVL